MKKRPKRKIRLIVALLATLSLPGLKAQVLSRPDVLFSVQALKKPLIRPGQGFSPAIFNTGSVWIQGQPFDPAPGPGKTSQHILKADFYAQQLGFFCKKEWKLEQSIHFPIRFRLGSLEYCNYLEGKNNAVY